MGAEAGANTGSATGRWQRMLSKLHQEWMEILSALLLSLATLASSWCAYQAARWRGEEAAYFSLSNAARIHAAEAGGLADARANMDQAQFLTYLDALLAGDLTKADFMLNRAMRPEMRAAVRDWLQTMPLDDPDSPGDPFVMGRISDPERERAGELEAQASEYTRLARESIRHSDDYVLLTVLFAAVLFFAGISPKFKTHWISVSVLAMGGALFLATLCFALMKPTA